MDGFESGEKCPDRSPEPRKCTPTAVVVEGPTPEIVIIEQIKGLMNRITDSNLNIGHAEKMSIETG